MSDRPTYTVQTIKRDTTVSGFDITVGLFFLLSLAVVLMPIW